MGVRHDRVARVVIGGRQLWVVWIAWVVVKRVAQSERVAYFMQQHLVASATLCWRVIDCRKFGVVEVHIGVSAVLRECAKSVNVEIERGTTQSSDVDFGQIASGEMNVCPTTAQGFLKTDAGDFRYFGQY